jgi:hypothetical protein
MYPHERSLVKAMENKPFVLIGINSDPSKDALKKVIADEKMTWRSFWDGGNTSGPIATKWNVHGWPTLYVVDHKGVIRHKWVGSPGEEKMDKSLEKLVKTAEEDAKKSEK